MIFLHEIENEILTWEGDEQPNYLYYTLDDADLDTFLEETQASGVGGYFQVFGVEEVVRSYMERRNLTVLNLDICQRLEGTQAGTTILWKHLQVLYTAGNLRYSGTADNLVLNHFLTPTPQTIIHRGESFSVGYYLTDAETASLSIEATMRDGSVQTVTDSVVTGYGTYGIAGTDFADAAKIKLTLGNRTFTVYVMEDAPCERFQFLNFFNVPERICLTASINRNPSTEYETAQLSHITIPYDIEHKEEYNLTTSPLSSVVANNLQWMVRSRKVVQLDGKYNPQIIIKDYSLPRSTNPNTPITFEMTFEYADTQLPNTLIL